MNVVFAGNSRFASDFTQIIDRALRIAALPKLQLVNQQSELSRQQDSWSAVQTKFASLRGSLTSLVSSVGTSGVTSTSTDSSVARPTTSAGVLQGNYSVEVIDIGAKTTALGVSGVANPATDALASVSQFTLTANGASIIIEPAAMNLSSLADAINQNSAAGVSATLINVASSGSPASYRLSLQSTTYSANPIQLSYESSGTQQLMDVPTLGAAVTYRVNGYPVTTDPPLSSNSRTLAISPGLSLSVGKVGVAEISVLRIPTTLTSAISNFVTAYNASVDELDKSHGLSAGPLKGQSSINLLGNSLRRMLSHSGTGAVSSIEGLGIEFGTDGKLTFDTSVIGSMSPSELASTATFLGDGTTDGLLKKAAAALSEADSSTFGVLPNELTQLTTQLADKQVLIDENQRRVDTLEISLAARMSAADALISSLEQQVTYFTGMFESMRANSFR